MNLIKSCGIKGLQVLLAVLLLSSCASNKSILYLQNSDAVSKEGTVKFENKLQADDILVITVTSDPPSLANPFNIIFLNMASTEMRTMNNDALISYQIDPEGNIDFPVLGKMALAGLTRTEAESKIKTMLADYLPKAGVNLRVLNFKVSVIGEVVRPGEQMVAGDRFTLLEAISRAGDLTIYGNRKEVMVIREVDGVRTINEIDISDADFVNSPYYYLAHNDMIYIKPNKTRVNSSVIGPNVTVAISAISLIITIIALSVR